MSCACISAEFAASSLEAGENSARIQHPLAAHCQYYSNQAAWKTLGSEKPRLASIVPLGPVITLWEGEALTRILQWIIFGFAHPSHPSVESKFPSQTLVSKLISWNRVMQEAVLKSSKQLEEIYHIQSSGLQKKRLFKVCLCSQLIILNGSFSYLMSGLKSWQFPIWMKWKKGLFVF